MKVDMTAEWMWYQRREGTWSLRIQVLDLPATYLHTSETDFPKAVAEVSWFFNDA